MKVYVAGKEQDWEDRLRELLANQKKFGIVATEEVREVVKKLNALDYRRHKHEAYELGMKLWQLLERQIWEPQLQSLDNILGMLTERQKEIWYSSAGMPKTANDIGAKSEEIESLVKLGILKSEVVCQYPSRPYHIAKYEHVDLYEIPIKSAKEGIG